MQRVVLDVKDTMYEHLMFFINHIDKNEVKIVSHKKFNKNQIIQWNEKELESIGKIGFVSESFEDDDEDYSKWLDSSQNKKKE